MAPPFRRTGSVALPLFLLGLLGQSSFSPGAAADPAKAGKVRVYVGTYTQGKSKGIYLMEMDPATGKLSAPVLAAETVNPSFLAIHPNQRFLYAVSEVSDTDGKKSGAVAAFALEPKTGKLRLLNKQASKGAGPCHLVVDRQGKNVLVANYGAGTSAVLPITEDGRLEPATGFQQHEGSSVNKERQEGPHAHSINLDPANRFAFAADLGLDKVLVFKFDPDRGTITPNDPPAARVPPGSGPRHFAFHPRGRFAYVINEMLNTVTAFAYDPEKGELREVQTISTLPKGFQGKTWTAEVVVHPSGKFVYGSNRGHDSIAAFAVDQETGKLKFLGTESTQGKIPRNFAIDPTGNYLLAANQDSDTVVVFRIDFETGRLQPTDHKAEVPMPVCLRMIPLAP